MPDPDADSEFEQAMQAADICFEFAERALNESQEWKRKAFGWIEKAREQLEGELGAFLDPLPSGTVPSETPGLYEEG